MTVCNSHHPGAVARGEGGRGRRILLTSRITMIVVGVSIRVFSLLVQPTLASSSSSSSCSSFASPDEVRRRGEGPSHHPTLLSSTRRALYISSSSSNDSDRQGKGTEGDERRNRGIGSQRIGMRGRRDADLLLSIRGGLLKDDDDSRDSSTTSRNLHHHHSKYKRDRSSSSSSYSGSKESPASSSAAAKDEKPPTHIHFKLAPASLKVLNGVFYRTDWDHHGRAHYEKTLTAEEAQESGGEDRRTIHLYWHSNQWVIHYDLDPAFNYDNYLGYCKITSIDPGRTDKHWFLREKKKWIPAPTFRAVVPGRVYPEEEEEAVTDVTAITTPSRLVPVLIAFFFDAVGTGLASPLLPFYIMGLGANAFQLGLVLAFNYLAQTIGCIVMGNISDKYGRRQVILCCLCASFVSLSVVGRAQTLVQVGIGRVLGGMFGGFVPIAQSAVADLCPVETRPKFLGRIQACMGLGFVVGPAIYLVLSKFFHLSTRDVLQRAAVLPAIAFTYALFFVKETKDHGPVSSSPPPPVTNSNNADSPSGSWALPPPPVRLLVLNGFLLMYAFSVETVYAMFIKDNFGYGESALGTVFALNGVAVGVLQVFWIKNLFATLGKHVMLAFGNILLAAGMVGLSLLRYKLWHFTMFSVHIIGYAISDTALASLITRYSDPDQQGKNLGWSHAAQSCARIISPLVAGYLYEMSKAPDHPLPPGALPYIAGSAMPLLGVMVPTILYLRSIEAKRIAAGEKVDK